MIRRTWWLRNSATRTRNHAGNYAYILAVAFAIGVGVYFRTVGVFTDRFSFWLDEAVWAHLVKQADWYRHAIRPLGYLAISRLLVELHDTELPLRMLAYVPGILSLVLFLLVLKSLFSRRLLIVAGLLIVATHPALIDYSREYKPYALSVFMHLALMLSALRYTQDPSSHCLALASGLACMSPLLAIDAVFALPAVFAVLFAKAYREGDRRHMTAVAALVIVALAITTCLYVFIWHTEAGPAAKIYWGRKYGVFHTGSWAEPRHQSTWLWDKTRTLILSATASDENFEVTWETDLVISAFFAAVPLALWRRQFLPAILLAAPIVTTLAFHLLGLWPWGRFRANQFLIIYIVLLTLYSFELLGRGSRRRLVSIGVTAIAFFLISAHCPTDFSAHDRKRSPGDSSLKKALEVVREHHFRRHEKDVQRAKNSPGC